MKSRISIVIAIAIASFGLTSSPAYASGTQVRGDIIRSNVSWDVQGSPYLISSAVQIADGATLTIQPGVELRGVGARHMFKVAGKLVISGSVESPVVIDAGKSASLIEVAATADNAVTQISRARISNGKALLPPTGNGGKIQFRLQDSQVRNMSEYNYVWYPLPGSIISGNTFQRSGGFSIGIDSRTEATPPIEVRGNRFRTASTTGYWIENWAAYGQPLPVHDNSFEAPGTPSVALRLGYSSSAIDATENYWGTTNPKVIASMIVDGMDDIDYASVIAFEPFLTAPATNAPTTTPSAPTAVTASALLGGRARVAWSTPATGEELAGTTFVVASEPAGAACSVTGETSCVVAGLQEARSYTFTVTATNSMGSSAPSLPSSPFVAGESEITSPDRVSDGRITAAPEGHWPKPEGCGSYLVSFSGITPSDIGSIEVVDADSGDRIESELFLFDDVSAGVFSMEICRFEVEDTRWLRLVLDFGGQEVEGPAFRWDSGDAPSPRPQPLPGRATLGPISVATEGIWTAPDGCGNYLFTYSGITDDDIGSVNLIDPATRDIVAMETFLGRVGNGLGNTQICSSDIRQGQSLVWQLDFADSSVVEGPAFTWQTRAPQPATPQDLPSIVSLGPITVSTTGDWSFPGSCRDYTFDYVGWGSEFIGSVTLIEATTRDVIASEVFISKPSSGSGNLFVCGFEVRPSSRLLLQVDASGLGTAESDVFTWEGSAASIIITGSRTTIKGKPGIRVEGSVSGLPAGTKLAPKVKFGKKKFRTFKATISVRSNQEFAWQRRTKQRSVVIIQTADGSVVSNRVRINPRRR